MDTHAAKTLPDWTPYAVGGAFVVLFASLCLWQVSRGLEKREQQQLFEAGSGYSAWSPGMNVRPFQRLKVTGRFDSDRQFLLENIVVRARPGYYVITPLVPENAGPVLLVNRGWLPKPDGKMDAGFVSVQETRVTVRGRAGSLPRAGMKMGEGIAPGQGWPRLAVFPDFDEIERSLDREVYPLVLLMDPEDDFGFVREWQPPRFGPGRHFGYAFQWFVMGAVLAGLLVRNYRRKGLSRSE